MALTQSKQRKFYDSTGKMWQRGYSLGSGVELYAGALIGMDDSGYAVEASTANKFVGVNRGYVKNETADAVDTTQACEVDLGQVETIANTNAALSDIGKAFYAYADDTVSRTAGSAPHLAGYCVDVIVSTSVDIRILADES